MKKVAAVSPPLPYQARAEAEHKSVCYRPNCAKRSLRSVALNLIVCLFVCLFVCNQIVVIFALGICVGDISRFPTGIGRSKCHKDFEEPEKSAQKLALRFETSTFEDPVLDHFLDTFFEHFPQKWRFAPPACGLLSSINFLGDMILNCLKM